MVNLKFNKKGVVQNKNSGITLIALVITIIVLLILAGISISMLSGNNGILQRATDAKTETERGQVYEQISLATASGEMDYYSNGTDRITAYKNALLNGVDGIDRDNLSDNGSNLITGTVTTKSGKQYDFSVPVPVTDITVAEHDNTEYPIVSNTLKAGDYVEYNNKPYIVLYDKDSEYNWVEIVSVNPLESVTFGKDDNTTGAQGTLGSYYRARWSYNNAVSTLNTIAQNYLIEDLADRARCVGSNPTNPLSEGAIRSYDKIKATDTNYLNDHLQLGRIGARTFTDANYEYYWYASRGSDGSGSINEYYGLFHEDRAGTNYSKDDWRRIDSILNTNEVAYEDYEQDYNFYYDTKTAGFRPVIRLISTIKVIDGDGSSNSPYILQK